VRLWARVRGTSIILSATAVTILALIVPGSAASATPSPAGATLVAASMVALIPMVAVGWGCSRADEALEAVAVRPIRLLDFGLALATSLTASAFALGLDMGGFAPAGTVASRATVTYFGLLLMAQPLLGWRVATVVPTSYLLAVALFGRGEDIYHPAAWAWIAAPATDPASWSVTLAAMLLGVAWYLIGLRNRPSTSP